MLWVLALGLSLVPVASVSLAAVGVPWATQAGGTSSDQGRGVSTLSDGSAIVTGFFQGTATFGSTTLTSAGDNDVFVAKIDTAGTYLWATQAGGTSADSSYGVSTLSDGSAIVTGSFQGTATFGSTTLTSAGRADVFVAKIDAAGTYLWATQVGGTGPDVGYAVSTLSDGSAIVTGFFQGTATFGSTTLTSAGDNDVFVAKIDAAGTYLWATQAGGTSPDHGRGISTLSDGSAIVTGNFQGTATFGSTTLTSAGSSDVFVAKIDASGAYVWATDTGGASAEAVYGISTLSDGSAIVTGNFQGTATFGSTTLTSAGRADVFVAKINASGTYLWATQAGGTGPDVGSAVSALSDGSAIVTGYFEGTATFGSTTLTSAGGSDVFVAKINASGTYLWATSAGGTATDGGNDVSTFSDGSAIVTGSFQGTATFGSTTLTSAGGYDVFVAEFISTALTPTFGTPSSTADGFTVQISNYSTDYTWGKSTTAGTVSISSSGLITVTGLTSGQSATVTVTTTRTGYDNGSAQVSGGAIADSDGDGINDNEDPFPLSDTEEATGGITLRTTPPTANSGCSIDSLAVTDVAAESPRVAVNGIGKGISFALSGCDTTNLETLTIRIDLGAAPAEGSAAMKIDSDGNWSQIEGATIEGSVVTYTITDNGPLDQDSDPGTMADPVTVAVPYSAPALPVPALPALAMGLLSLLLGLFGYRRLAH